MNAVEMFVKTLKNESIEFIFGIPGGGALLDIIDAACKEDIDYIVTTHEGTVAIMAAVYGQLIGRPGVCLMELPRFSGYYRACISS